MTRNLLRWFRWNVFAAALVNSIAFAFAVVVVAVVVDNDDAGCNENSMCSDLLFFADNERVQSQVKWSMQAMD